MSPGEEIRLEAAVRREDERMFLDEMSNLIAAPRIQRCAHLPPAVRAIVDPEHVAWARSYLLGRTYKAPPRLEGFLGLTLDTGLLIDEALELTWSQFDEESGRVVLSRDRGNGTRYQLAEEVAQLLIQLPHRYSSGPLLRLTRASLHAAWARVCEDAGVAEVTLRDLQFEAQYRRRIRELARGRSQRRFCQPSSLRRNVK